MLKRFSSLRLNVGPDGSINISDYVVIDHNSGGYLLFNFFVTACCIVSSYIYVYTAAHRIHIEQGVDKTKTVGEEETFNWVMFFILFFEGVFFLDICVNFLLTYEYMGQYGRQIENNVGKISTHYFYSTFYKDFIPIIPF